jgi:hypothetical protein
MKFSNLDFIGKLAKFAKLIGMEATKSGRAYRREDL